MNKFAKIITTAGSAVLLLSGTAMADPPAGVAFDAWTANGATNTITFGVACPAGYTCGTPVTGNGFLQRQLIDGSGNQFFQTVVAPESGAAGAKAPSTLAFTDETFVRVGTTGVSGKQRAVDSTVSGPETTTVNTSTIVNSGWAAGGATYKDLEIGQAITVMTTATSEVNLYNGFTFNQNGTSTAPTGKFLDVTQAVLITGDATTTDNLGDDVQKFVMRQASGDLNNSARALGGMRAFPASAGVLLPGKTANNDLAWAATDDVKVIWVGQQMVQSGVESFRYQFYDNLTTAAADSISDFQVGAADPWTWVNPFGTLPTMTVP